MYNSELLAYFFNLVVRYGIVIHMYICTEEIFVVGRLNYQIFQLYVRYHQPMIFICYIQLLTLCGICRSYHPTFFQ